MIELDESRKAVRVVLDGDFDARMVEALRSELPALADRGVDADDPQLAELSPAVAAVAIGIYAGPQQRFLDGSQQVASSAAISFGLSK